MLPFQEEASKAVVETPFINAIEKRGQIFQDLLFLRKDLPKPKKLEITKDLWFYLGQRALSRT